MFETSMGAAYKDIYLDNKQHFEYQTTFYICIMFSAKGLTVYST